MSSRPQFSPFSVITDGDMSQTTLTSAVTIIQKLSMVSYSVAWAGSTPVGTVSVELSNDYKQNEDGTVRNAGTWQAITFNLGGAPVSTAPVTGNTGNGFIDITETAGYAIRLKYTKGSGTGTMNVVIAGKCA